MNEKKVPMFTKRLTKQFLAETGNDPKGVIHVEPRGSTLTLTWAIRKGSDHDNSFLHYRQDRICSSNFPLVEYERWVTIYSRQEKVKTLLDKLK